jgi:hypothetical protein
MGAGTDRGVSVDEQLEKIIVRLDDQGRLINEHGEHIATLDRRHSRLAAAIYGDEELSINGLLQRQAGSEAALLEITNWRRTIEVQWKTAILLIKFGLAVMTVTGVGVWVPILKALTNGTP